MIQKFIITAFALMAMAMPARALDGGKTVYLVDKKGDRIAVASVEFTASDAGASYEIAMKESPFEDHFLSMRPFKCLEGAQKHWCHVPYPYEIRRTVTTDDLTIWNMTFSLSGKAPPNTGSTCGMASTISLNMQMAGSPGFWARWTWTPYPHRQMMAIFGRSASRMSKKATRTATGCHLS